jgi:hypothetical protein
MNAESNQMSKKILSQIVISNSQSQKWIIRNFNINSIILDLIILDLIIIIISIIFTIFFISHYHFYHIFNAKSHLV